MVRYCQDQSDFVIDIRTLKYNFRHHRFGDLIPACDVFV